MTAAATQPAKSEREVFHETFFDPQVQGADPRYSHAVELTKEQVRDVIEKVDALEQRCQAFNRVQGTYLELDAWLTQSNVEDAFFARMKSGQGFKYPDLPELWAKYSDKGGPDLNLPEYIRLGYFGLRIGSIKKSIVRGRATEGDLKFLEHAYGYTDELMIRIHGRLRIARRLEGYLKAEGMLGENPAVVARQRARSEQARERWENNLQRWGDDMLERGDPGLKARRQREQDERDAARIMEEVRRDSERQR